MKNIFTQGINVDDFVRIGPAHSSNTASCSIGDGLRVGRNAEIDSTGGISIGSRVTISEDAKIYTHDHIIDDGPIDWRQNGIKKKTLIIEDDVWIGSCAIVLASVGRICLLYTSPSPRDRTRSRMPSSA